jgi:transcriptional regulator with XRE-family HTH domain
MAAPHPNDVLVGANIRFLRNAAHMSQIDLGEHLGVTFQQVQKYEKGTNRVGAGRIITRFFDGAKTPKNRRPPPQLLGKRDAFRLAEAFEKITSPRQRQSIVALVQTLSEP